MTHRRWVVAVDLGASSGRVALTQWDGARGRLDEVHRFDNAPIARGGHLFWDVDRLWDEIRLGLDIAARRAGAPLASIGIDGWAVDYALVDRRGDRTAPVFCYRDARNPPAMQRALSILPRERLYATTGIQFLPFNTVYQLLAHATDREDEWKRAQIWLNLPEYFLFRLSGVAVAEYTNATHTQMVDVATRRWSPEIADALGLDLAKFPPIVPPGTMLGTLRPAIADTSARLRDMKVIAPACHDTGSAVAALPLSPGGAFISSGTWSLVGTVLDAPVLTSDARDGNFTNEGGVGGTIRFLKNVIGLWLLQQCVEQWRAGGSEVSESSLAEAAAACPCDGPRFDVDNDAFLAPGDMPGRIARALEDGGQPVVDSPVEIAAAVFRSLARRYADVLRRAETVTGRLFDSVCIGGGGVKNRVLTAWTAQATGLPVIEGPSEPSLLGNAAVQIAALDETTAAVDIRAIAAALES